MHTFQPRISINAKYLDEPYGGSLSSWFIYKEMKSVVKVCLTGTGADELYGNYYKWKSYNGFLSLIRKSKNT